MQGPSRGALVAVTTQLQQLLAGGLDAGRAASELFAVTDLLDGNASLRRALADPMRPDAAKTGLVDRLLGGRISSEIADLVRVAVTQRWSEERDLPSALDQLGVGSVFVAADRRGRADQVEEELFRFERTVSGNPALRDAFADRQRTGADKSGLVRTLLEGRVEPETLTLATRAAAHPRGLRYERALESYLQTAASVRGQLTATVTSAVELTPAQRERLVATLTRMYGRPVTLGAVVDPQVVGGIRVQVGDEVIDGTIARRIDEVRRNLAS